MNIYCVLLKYINIPLRATQQPSEISGGFFVFVHLKKICNENSYPERSQLKPSRNSRT